MAPAQTAPAETAAPLGVPAPPLAAAPLDVPAPPQAAAPLGVPAPPQGAFRMVRSMQRNLEIFQVKLGKYAVLQVTTHSAPSRPQAIQWAGILKEVLEAGATVPEARIIKNWMQKDERYRWGNQQLNVITGGEMLAYLRG